MYWCYTCTYFFYLLIGVIYLIKVVEGLKGLKDFNMIFCFISTSNRRCKTFSLTNLAFVDVFS